MEQQQTQHRTPTAARLRFVLGAHTVDIALPTEVPLADLLPAVLPQFGAEEVEQGAEHEGWTVQRLGEAPLDEDRTLAELNLLDGETVHVRARADEFAAIAYDDLVDGLGERVHAHSGTWRPVHTRWMLRIAATAALVVGLLLVADIGQGTVRTVLAGTLAVSLLAASALVTRGALNPHVGLILAACASAYATLAGWSLVATVAPSSPTMVLLTGAAAVALVALAAGLVAVADAGMVFTAALTFVAVWLVAGVIASASALSPTQAVAIGLAVTLFANAFVPTTAFRLAGLTLPLLPGGPEELNEDIDSVPYEVVRDRATATVGYGTALHTGIGLAQVTMFPALVLAGSGWRISLALVMALLLFLRARHPSVFVQRWAVFTPAAVCVVATVLYLGSQLDTLTMLLGVFVPVLIVCGVLLVLGQRLPERRLVPPWPRAVEIFELLTAIAVLPLLLQVLHVYTAMRSLAS